ncbi:hypothetical protein [Phaffia rhodozyma]|uniref:Uncharacterized protein n=1 Tax=Phaffia rhodozyma TaxID=264483 RepID=A0A0F7SE68_PHARH|nr:hypothetical protein [Phaffia rhodozyma]
MLSQVLPTIVSSIIRSFQSLSSPDSRLLPSNPALSLSVDSHSQLLPQFASFHLVPFFNLVLTVVVFLYLIDEQTHADISRCVDTLTGNKYNCSVDIERDPSYVTNEKGLPVYMTPSNASSTARMSDKEQAVLTGLVAGCLLSMMFHSDSVLDVFASTIHIHSEHFRMVFLRSAVLYFAFTVMSAFLFTALVMTSLSSIRSTYLPPLLFLLCPILLSSTITNRFLLACTTFDLTSSPHLALLIGEPIVLISVLSWMAFGPGGTSVRLA